MQIKQLKFIQHTAGSHTNTPKHSACIQMEAQQTMNPDEQQKQKLNGVCADHRSDLPFVFTVS